MRFLLIIFFIIIQINIIACGRGQNCDISNSNKYYENKYDECIRDGGTPADCEYIKHTLDYIIIVVSGAISISLLIKLHKSKK